MIKKAKNENKENIGKKYSIYNSGENNDIKRKTTYGFYGNRLNDKKESIIKSNDINDFGFKKILFKKIDDNEENHLNSIEYKGYKKKKITIKIYRYK